MEKEDLISIIIPVYKVEKYLDKCVQSVVNQSYHNIEVILVDDGSPDSCPQICDEWAKKDKRIKVVHKQNGGLSDARNVGIDKAKEDVKRLTDIATSQLYAFENTEFIEMLAKSLINRDK